MIITCDIGNTSTKLGLYDKDERIAFLIVDSKTTTAFKSSILQMIYKSSLRCEQIEDGIISSVIPSLTEIVSEAIKEVINKEPIIINQNNFYGIEIDESVEAEVSSDLLVMCAYAYQLFKQELIVCSLGSVSVLCHITSDGKLKHCIIAPGYASFEKGVHLSAAQLPSITVQRKGTFLASNTSDAISIGVCEGYIGMIKYLIAGLRKTIGEQIRVVSCGGVTKEIMSAISNNEYYNPDFISDGLNYIYNRYIKHE